MNGVVCLRSTLKGQGGNLRVVNLVSPYFGTTEPDFSEETIMTMACKTLQYVMLWLQTVGGSGH